MPSNRLNNFDKFYNENKDKLLEILNNEVLQQKIITKGNEELSKYPSINEKTKLELDYIKTIYETNY